MSLYFHDRVMDRTVETPPEQVVLGRYRLLFDGVASLNSARLSSGDYLIPDQEGRWTILTEGGQATVGEFPPTQLPPQREQDSLRQIGGRLEKLLDSGATWEQWSEVSPIVPEILAKAKMQPLDNAVKQYLCHLQEACRHPRTHLRMEIERMPVPRARRIPSQAVEYLASHTEDWQHRKLTSVVPKRILSVMVDDQFDIYENRVAVRLVDHLYRYLCGRLEEIRKLQRLFDEVRLKPEASHWRLTRVCGLLGQAVLDEGPGAAAQTRQALESLHYQILQLFDSLLYKAMSPQLQVPPTLKATNILANDRHYRYIGLLWRMWSQYGFKHPKTGAERYHERQDLCRGFDRFCALLVFRALTQLGFELKGEASLEPGITSIRLLDGLGQELLLSWNEYDTFTIKKNDQALIRFVPLVAALALEPDAGRLDETLCSLLAQLPSESAPCFEKPLDVILYSSDWEQRERLPIHLQQQLQSLGNDLVHPSSVGMVPVSTYEIDSVERVARATRWVILGSQIMDYPPRISIPVSYVEELTGMANWLRRTDQKDLVRVVRLPSSGEKRKFDQKLADMISRLVKVGKTSAFQIELLEAFQKGQEAAFKEFLTWLQCPVCLRENEPRMMKVSHDDHFECHCVHCDSYWGTRGCGHCGRRFPFVALGGTGSTYRPQYVGWVDDVLGMDVLAVPCWLPNSRGSYICPWCGTCRNAGSRDGAACLRCSEPECVDASVSTARSLEWE